MAKANDKIPVNCDKILFVEDVVSHILYKILQVQYQPKVATPYREFIYQAFDETVRTALDDVYKRVAAYNILFNVVHQPLNQIQYHRFAMKFLKKYFKDGFDPRYLFYYSVHLSMVAAKMVDSIGLQKAGNLAVHYILKGFRGCDMFTGGWDVLHMMASTYANRRDFMDNLTPDFDMIEDQDVEDAEDDAISDEDDSNEDYHQLQNAEVASGLDNENNEQSPASGQDLEENRKLVNKDVQVCLDNMKDMLEKELEPEIIQSTSSGACSSHQKHASNKQAEPSSFVISRREKSNSPPLPELNLSSVVEEKGIGIQCAVAKDLTSPILEKTRSPKRDHAGFEINRSICMSHFPSTTSNFISGVSVNSETKTAETLTELLENELNIAKRSKTVFEESQSSGE